MQGPNHAEPKGDVVTTPSMWWIAALCALQICYLVLELYRHWATMTDTSRILLVVYLVAYPFPLLRLMKKDINRYMVAIVVYGALGVAAFLIFPIAR